MSRSEADAPGVGDLVGPLTVGPVAHGGHWVARHEGRVLFVRHALEGETVRVRVTGLAARHGFADVVEVIDASPHRVTPPCPVAGFCGGCDFQHVAVAHQRDLKRQVVVEQLRRLAGVGWSGTVEALEPDALGWRTRMRYHGAAGAWGLRAHRSDAVVPLPDQGCLIADPRLARPADSGLRPAVGAELVGVAAADGVRWVTPRSSAVVTEDVVGRRWRVAASGFWQVHPQAAARLGRAVLDALEPRPGERALDLYCGVGLFAGVLADAGVDVLGIEGDPRAVTLAQHNVPEATFWDGSVEVEARRGLPAADLVVLDPPRVGARRPVMDAVLATGARRVAYVACDPAALARDVEIAAGHGWRMASLRAFDLFPMTHHVECVAVLEPPDAPARA